MVSEKAKEWFSVHGAVVNRVVEKIPQMDEPQKTEVIALFSVFSELQQRFLNEDFDPDFVDRAARLNRRLSNLLDQLGG
jgi:hypothetical protein